MENRKDTLTALKLCRFCLSQDETLTSLYDRNRAPKNSVPLPLKILSCVSIEVFPSDRMPSYICNRCKFFMDVTYEFKQMCRQADENVLQYIQSGTDLSSATWPSSLQKLFRVATKSAPELAVMKTVVEGGATVQVTAQESDSEDEDDENVYNVKIGDGSDEGPKNARVKLITGDKQNKGKAKQGKGFLSVSKLTSHVRTHAGERSYPCKYCNKSFIKSHHYTRHLRVKHRENIRTCRGPFGESPDQYRCEQCEDIFSTQDELIYHSAIHATQNLTCPLCQEKFEDVDAVTAHIKSHVNGTEFMCDLCELVFTTKDKLENHVSNAHEDEIRSEETVQDESSVEMDEDEEEEATINLKEEDDHMVVEIKKPDNFMLSNSQSDELKVENINSEDSDSEITFTGLATVETLMNRKEAANAALEKSVSATPGGAFITKTVASKSGEKNSVQTAPILRRAEEVKRKVQPIVEAGQEKKNTKAESNDKSLRLLEKELQELKRTNTRSEVVKTPAKFVDALRNRRPQIYTSTPKFKVPAVEEKKIQISTKSSAPEKKQPDRRIVTKENKEPKEVKEIKGNNGNAKDEKEKEVKEKETPKNVIKNGTNEKGAVEEGIRRSTRPSKIKDYAKMIRDRSQDSDDEDDSDEVDEEYKETEKSTEKSKARKVSIKTPTKVTAAPAPAAPPATAPTPARKRGRPRKSVASTPVPAKIRKEENKSVEEKSDEGEKDSDSEMKPKENAPPAEKVSEKSAATDISADKDSKSISEVKPASGVLVSPTGQTLKKIPIKALPPGIKPLPLPVNARPIPGGEVCEMQIGKKVVKVQKIVMTKAEVEAMAKKGLVEMKDGTMVLKQGIKIPTSDPSAIKNLVGEESATKESNKSDKATPTRCNIDDET